MHTIHFANSAAELRPGVYKRFVESLRDIHMEVHFSFASQFGRKNRLIYVIMHALVCHVSGVKTYHSSFVSA